MRELKWTNVPKYDSNLALNIFGLITIFDFFQDTFVSIFKTKRPSDYFALFLFLALWRASLFLHFCIWSPGSTTVRGPHFFVFLLFCFVDDALNGFTKLFWAVKILPSEVQFYV